MRKLRNLDEPKVLRGVRPNAGVEAKYRERLLRHVERMNRSVLYWVRAAYRANEPRVAMDATWEESKHPRDADGQFVSSGSGSGGNHYDLSDELDTELFQDASLKTPLSVQEESTLRDYTENAGYALNRALRYGLTDETDNHIVRVMDKIFERASLARNVVVHRQVDKDTYESIARGGTSYVDKGYMSTTANPEKLKGPYVLKIRLREGTHALPLGNISEYGVEEQEILVNRGTHFEVSHEDGQLVLTSRMSPHVAQDATPADLLAKVVAELRKRWQKSFDDLADQLAEHFAQAAENRSSRALAKMFRDAGFTVEFRMTAAQRDVIDAIVHENVSLIKSIPQKYLQEVEGHVMRSVSAGRDLETLTKNIQKTYGVTRRRAQLIARDQNNKAGAMLGRARQLELGVEQAVWKHSHAGKHPRPTHVKMDGKPYDVSKGMWDSDVKKYVLPGELINCRCYAKPVIAGFR